MRNSVETGRPATLKDVAREAGVSAMAVSNVLNNRGGVSEETRATVLAAAEKLSYTPNRVAQSLRSARTQTIGVVMSDSSQYVFANLLRGIEYAASARGYSVLLANTNQNQSVEAEKISLLAGKRIDGLLLAAPLGTGKENIDFLRSLQIPFVLLMRSTEFKDVNYVANDNKTGGYISVKHLYELGEREFIFIALDSSSGRERMVGYQRCLSEYGLNLEDFCIVRVSPQIEDGYEAMRRIIAAGHRQGAVCCGCDMIAIGAMNAILKANLRIPEDFRLIGYDDFELTQYLRVPLSSVRQPVNRIGSEGVRLLLDRIDDNSMPDQAVILQPELIVRQSSVRI